MSFLSHPLGTSDRSWHGGRPQPRRHCGFVVLDGDQAPSPKRGPSPLPNFRPISIVAKRLDASIKMPLGMEIDIPQSRGLCVR